MLYLIRYYAESFNGPVAIIEYDELKYLSSKLMPVIKATYSNYQNSEVANIALEKEDSYQLVYKVEFAKSWDGHIPSPINIRFTIVPFTLNEYPEVL